MCGWGPHAREASVWEACCWYSDVITEEMRLCLLLAPPLLQLAPCPLPSSLPSRLLLVALVLVLLLVLVVAPL